MADATFFLLVILFSISILQEFSAFSRAKSRFYELGWSELFSYCFSLYSSYIYTPSFPSGCLHFTMGIKRSLCVFDGSIQTNKRDYLVPNLAKRNWWLETEKQRARLDFVHILSFSFHLRCFCALEAWRVENREAECLQTGLKTPNTEVRLFSGLLARSFKDIDGMSMLYIIYTYPFYKAMPQGHFISFSSLQ